SRQFFFSWAIAGSRNVTPPCLAMPSQTCSTFRFGTSSARAATGEVNVSPINSALDKIMTALRLAIQVIIAWVGLAAAIPQAVDKLIDPPGAVPVWLSLIRVGDRHVSGAALQRGLARC